MRGTPENSRGEAATFPKALDTTNKEESFWTATERRATAVVTAHRERSACRWSAMRMGVRYLRLPRGHAMIARGLAMAAISSVPLVGKPGPGPCQG